MGEHTMIATVQAYIAHRTGKEIQIYLRPNSNDIAKLMQAYGQARIWFDNNNGTIVFI